MTVTVYKSIGFDAAHYLPEYKGKCANLHGHHWKVRVGLAGPVDVDGMVIDFTEVKDFLKNIESEFDHHLVNSIIPMPTAENIALRIVEKSKAWVWTRPQVQLASVEVWETEDSCCKIDL